MISLALRLGKSIAEVEAMPAPHLTEWEAYFNLEADDAFRKELEETARAAAIERQRRWALKKGGKVV